MKDMLDTRAVAKMLGVSYETVRWHRKKGNLPEPDTFFGLSPVWLRSTIEEWDTTRSKRSRVDYSHDL